MTLIGLLERTYLRDISFCSSQTLSVCTIFTFGHWLFTGHWLLLTGHSI
ncbi:hypothetical protein [Scytonema sp. NUACC26]